MHEMSLVKAAVRAVLAECEGKDVTKVVAVNMSIGAMRDVIEEYVPELFRFLSKGTVAADAEVRINRIPVTTRCRGCGAVFDLDMVNPGQQKCPGCGGTGNHALLTGMEFQIDSIEVSSDSQIAQNDPNLVQVPGAA